MTSPTASESARRFRDILSLVSREPIRTAYEVAARLQLPVSSTYLAVAELERLAVSHHLRRAGEIVAIAQPHDLERLRRRQHGAVARPRMVGVTLGDQGLVDRPRRVDVKAAGLAADAGRRGNQDIFGAPCA